MLDRGEVNVKLKRIQDPRITRI